MYNTHVTPNFLHSYDVIFKNVFQKNISIVKTYITAATITLQVDVDILHKQRRTIYKTQIFRYNTVLITQNFRSCEKNVDLREKTRITQSLTWQVEESCLS